MKAIIQQLVQEMVEEIFKTLEKDGLANIGQTIENLKAAVSGTVLKILKACIDEMDKELVDGAKKQRRQDGIRIQERNVPRTISTSLGDLTYSRTYFKVSSTYESEDAKEAPDGSETDDSVKGRYIYLVDQLIGVEAYERISKNAVALLLQEASSKSYQKAADDSKLAVSRQTVHNRLLALHDVAADANRVSETPKVIDLFVDEDHAHLNPKKSVMVPLVTITEGMDESDPKRHKTINPLHIAAYNMETAEFQEMVLDVLTQRYDFDALERVNIHADGGPWIKGLKDIIPKAVMVMDGYHLEKYIRSFSRLEGAAKYVSAIRSSFRKDNYESFENNCEKVASLQTSEDGIKKVREFVSYCADHWEAIVNRVKKETCGSCTEAMVSHVLSERLSRQPISWSKDGLRQMTMLVVYTKNGGVLCADDIGLHPDEDAKIKMISEGYAKYRGYAEAQAKTALNSKLDWSTFESEVPALGKVNGHFMVRKSLGSLESLSELIA